MRISPKLFRTSLCNIPNTSIHA